MNSLFHFPSHSFPFFGEFPHHKLDRNFNKLHCKLPDPGAEVDLFLYAF